MADEVNSYHVAVTAVLGVAMSIVSFFTRQQVKKIEELEKNTSSKDEVRDIKNALNGRMDEIKGDLKSSIDKMSDRVERYLDKIEGKTDKQTELLGNILLTMGSRNNATGTK